MLKFLGVLVLAVVTGLVTAYSLAYIADFAQARKIMQAQHQYILHLESERKKSCPF